MSSVLCSSTNAWELKAYFIISGSGKTTLMSLLTGDHPQSYTQLPPRSQLTLFGRPRSLIPTPLLRSLIGIVSPELFNAFPRHGGMSVWDAVGTGFDGGFVPLGQRGVGVGLAGSLTEKEIEWRVSRVENVLNGLGPHTWTRSKATGDPTATLGTFAKRAFVDISAGEQSMVLLMRALVGQPKLVLLDEVWIGMDEDMITAGFTYLRNGGVTPKQVVITVSHWEEEVPWQTADGVKRFSLDAGEGREL